MMLAAVFKTAGQPLQLEQRPIPTPRPGQALIRVCRCGLCASDISMTSGSPFDMPPGSIPGHEYSGEVIEAPGGPAAGRPPGGRLRAGDRVTALPLSYCGHCPACLADSPLHCTEMQPRMGGYGQYTLIEQKSALRLPDNLTFADGALIEPLAAALRGVAKLPAIPNAAIAVIGAGAMGASAIYWLRQRFPKSRIAAIARTTRHASLTAAMGADALLTSDETLSETLTQTLGLAPDIIIECAGKPGLLQQAIALIRPGGIILSLGGCMAPDPILPVLAMWKDTTLIFSVAYGETHFHQALAALEAGHLAPRALITETIPLTALPETFEAIRHGGGAAINKQGASPAKIMLDPFA